MSKVSHIRRGYHEVPGPHGQHTFIPTQYKTYDEMLKFINARHDVFVKTGKYPEGRTISEILGGWEPDKKGELL